MKKIIWKKKYLNDRSGFWFETNIKSLDWTYVIEEGYNSEKYYCYLFQNNFSDEVSLSKKHFKNIEDAQIFCENHLKMTAKKLNDFLQNDK